MPGPVVSLWRAFAGRCRAGHCGVASTGPQLSAAKLGSEQCLPPRANNRTSVPALLADGARCAPSSVRPLRAWLSRQPQPPLRSGQDRSLQAGVNGRFVGRGLDPSVPAHVAESCSCFSSVGVAASFSKYRSPLYRIFCRTFSTMVCSVRAVPVRTQSFRARVTPVYKRLR